MNSPGRQSTTATFSRYHPVLWNSLPKPLFTRYLPRFIALHSLTVRRSLLGELLSWYLCDIIFDFTNEERRKDIMQEDEVWDNGKKLLRFEIRFLLNRAAIDIAFHLFFFCSWILFVIFLCLGNAGILTCKWEDVDVRCDATRRTSAAFEWGLGIKIKIRWPRSHVRRPCSHVPRDATCACRSLSQLVAQSE